MKRETDHKDSEIVDRFGGTRKMARTCGVSDPAVSEWRRTGIPKLRRQYLKLRYKNMFKGIP